MLRMLEVPVGSGGSSKITDAGSCLYERPGSEEVVLGFIDPGSVGTIPRKWSLDSQMPYTVDVRGPRVGLRSAIHVMLQLQSEFRCGTNSSY